MPRRNPNRSTRSMAASSHATSPRAVRRPISNRFAGRRVWKLPVLQIRPRRPIAPTALPAREKSIAQAVQCGPIECVPGQWGGLHASHASSRTVVSRFRRSGNSSDRAPSRRERPRHHRARWQKARRNGDNPVSFRSGRPRGRVRTPSCTARYSTALGLESADGVMRRSNPRIVRQSLRSDPGPKPPVPSRAAAIRRGCRHAHVFVAAIIRFLLVCSVEMNSNTRVSYPAHSADAARSASVTNSASRSRRMPCLSASAGPLATATAGEVPGDNRAPRNGDASAVTPSAIASSVAVYGHAAARAHPLHRDARWRWFPTRIAGPQSRFRGRPRLHNSTSSARASMPRTVTSGHPDRRNPVARRERQVALAAAPSATNVNEAAARAGAAVDAPDRVPSPEWSSSSTNLLIWRNFASMPRTTAPSAVVTPRECNQEQLFFFFFFLCIILLAQLVLLANRIILRLQYDLRKKSHPISCTFQIFIALSKIIVVVFFS